MQVGEERSSNEAGKQSEFGYIKVKYAHNVFPFSMVTPCARRNQISIESKHDQTKVNTSPQKDLRVCQASSPSPCTRKSIV